MPSRSSRAHHQGGSWFSGVAPARCLHLRSPYGTWPAPTLGLHERRGATMWGQTPRHTRDMKVEGRWLIDFRDAVKIFRTHTHTHTRPYTRPCTRPYTRPYHMGRAEPWRMIMNMKKTANPTETKEPPRREKEQTKKGELPWTANPGRGAAEAQEAGKEEASEWQDSNSNNSAT